MRKFIASLIVFVVFSCALTAQTNNDTIQKLQNQIVTIEASISKLSNQINVANSTIRKLERKLSSSSDTIRILEGELSLTNNRIIELSSSLDIKIQESSDKTNNEITSLNRVISKNTLYWVLAVLLTAILSGVLFILLKTRLTKEKTGLSDQIKETSNAFREEVLKLDNQLLKVLDSQLQLFKADQHKYLSKTDDIDHSLALKIADEIIRIHKNLSNMDPDTKGLKQLSASVDRIQDNFRANGYEMVDMLGKPYDQGMKISANFRPDESLEAGEQIITRIIKPQVNYKGVMIQAAQVEVSVGE